MRLLTKSVTQVFTVYTQHGADTEDLAFIALYSPLAQPLMVTFYLLTIVCVVRPAASDWSHAHYSLLIGQVSVCDRYDIAELSLSQLRRCVTLQTGGLSVLVYWATLLLTLATTKVSIEDVLTRSTS